MARFYDRLLISLNEKKWIDKLKVTQVIDANNVCQYYFSGTDQEVWDMLKDFPNLAPPFPNFFIEMKSPKFIKSEKFGKIDTKLNLLKCWGVHFIALDLHDHDGFLSKSKGSLLELKFFLNAIVEKKVPPSSNLKWIIFSYLYIELLGGEIHGPLCCFMYLVDKKGGVIELMNEEGFICILFGKYKEGHAEFITRCLTPDMFPAYLAVSFMHCKNVIAEQIIPPSKLNKKFRKKHGNDLVKYHVLKIEPMKKILRIEGKSNELGIPKALHICRGHFKDYRKSGLFGKIPGIFWWDSHIRGNKKQGIVMKDYEIEKLKK